MALKTRCYTIRVNLKLSSTHDNPFLGMRVETLNYVKNYNTLPYQYNAKMRLKTMSRFKVMVWGREHSNGTSCTCDYNYNHGEKMSNKQNK